MLGLDNLALLRTQPEQLEREKDPNAWAKGDPIWRRVEGDECEVHRIAASGAVCSKQIFFSLACTESAVCIDWSGAGWLA